MSADSETRSKGRIGREALLDAATDVARRFRAFGEYGSEKRAVGALRRRQPGFEAAEYEEALAAALDLCDATVALVSDSPPELIRRLPDGELDWEPTVRYLAARHPGFALSTHRWLAPWVHYYFVAR